MLLRPRNFDLNLNRRQLLGSLVGLAGCQLLPKEFPSADEDIAFFVPSPERDSAALREKHQDFGSLEDVPKISVPGIDAEYRTLLTLLRGPAFRLQRVMTGGLLHSGVLLGGQLILVTRGRPSVLYSLDARTLEVLAVRHAPEEILFGGHVIAFGDSDLIAVTANSLRPGRYDEVRVYRSADLAEVRRMSSGGFQAHELRLSRDTGLLYVGHYGSYFKTGPYENFAGASAPPITAALQAPDDGLVFPACVSIIDPKNGAIMRRLSHTANGPQGHFAVDPHGEVYLTKRPPLMRPRGDIDSHPAFQEGLEHRNCLGEFRPLSPVTGTTIEIDRRFGRILMPDLATGSVLEASLSTPDQVRSLSIPEIQAFGLPRSLRFGRDERDIFVSCDRGIVRLDRETLRAIGSIPAPLMIHSHLGGRG